MRKFNPTVPTPVLRVTIPDPVDPIIPFTPTCPYCRVSLPFEGAEHDNMVNGHRCKFGRGVLSADTVESTVRFLYNYFPSLYGRSAWARWRIFDKLFLQDRNGYRWRAGKIVLVDNIDYKMGGFTNQHKPIDPIKNAEYKLKTNPQLRQADELAASLGVPSFIERVQSDMTALACPPQYWSSIDENSLIANIPDNVHNHWLHAALDMLEMIKTEPGSSIIYYGYKLPVENQLANVETILFDTNHRFSEYKLARNNGKKATKQLSRS